MPVPEPAPAPIPEDNGRDIYSSASRVPAAPREPVEDVALGSFAQEDDRES